MHTLQHIFAHTTLPCTCKHNLNSLCRENKYYLNIFTDIGRYPKLITVSMHMFKDIGQCPKKHLIPCTFLKIYIGQCPNDAKSYATIIYILYLGQNRKSIRVSTSLFYILSGRVFSSFFLFFFFLLFFFPISGSVFTGQANSLQKA